MVKPNTSLILSGIVNDNNYLNVCVDNNFNHVGMAELRIKNPYAFLASSKKWSTHFVDTEDPSGFVGSIPAPDVIDF